MPSEVISQFSGFPENAVATAQHGVANLCRAWTQVALGMMAAGNAELKVVQSICAVSPSAWQPILRPEAAPAAARGWLHDAEARYRAAVEAQLQANNALAAALIGASETILGGLPYRGVGGANERPAESERPDAEKTAGDAAGATGDAAGATGDETKQPRAA